MSLYDVVKPSLCESGKIKIGSLGAPRKSQSGGEYRLPVKLDHFLITTLNRDSSGTLIQDTALMDELKAEYADSDGKLRQIPITVLSNDFEDIQQSAWVSYVGKRLAARSDGVEITYYCKGGKWLDQPVMEPHTNEAVNAIDGKKNRLFKLHTTFNCVILSSKSRWGGVYRLRTTSVISAGRLLGSMMRIKELCGGRDNGVIRGLPLRLVVQPIQVNPDGKATTVYVVSVELIGKDLMEIQQMALERAKFELENRQQLFSTTARYKQLLALPGSNESPLEQAEICEEFHPELADSREPPKETDPILAKLFATEKTKDDTSGETHSEPDPEASGECDEYGVPYFTPTE